MHLGIKQYHTQYRKLTADKSKQPKDKYRKQKVRTNTLVKKKDKYKISKSVKKEADYLNTTVKYTADL